MSEDSGTDRHYSSGHPGQGKERSMNRMNSKVEGLIRFLLPAIAAALIMTVFLGVSVVYAQEVAAVADSDNDGISDEVEIQIQAQQAAADRAIAQAAEQAKVQQQAAEEIRLKAEADIAAQKKAVEAEQKRIADEQKAREDEIARKKAEEEARKAAEETQRKFEESLSASGMSDADFNALCKIVEAEDGHDSIEGRIGIANVILNRVRNPRFPNSIMGVITAPGQFGPVHSGSFAAAVPSASTINAVKQAVAGTNTVGNALYFHRGTSYGGKAFVAMAGAHGFFA